MFHPWGRVEGAFEEMLDSHLGPQGSCVLSHEFYETDQQRGFLRGYTLQVVRRHKIFFNQVSIRMQI